MRGMQWQLGTWEPSQNLFRVRGKQRKPVSRGRLQELPDAHRLLASRPAHKSMQKIP
jgi:hypothetical protein